MPTLVEHGYDISGTTAERPASAEPGCRYYDTTLGTLVVWDGTSWVGPGGVVAVERTFTETAGAGVYTGSVIVPAGATLLDIIVHAVALWDNAGAVTMDVGEATDDPNGYYAGINLKATDLLATESLSFSHAGGKGGAYFVGTNTHVTDRYASIEREIEGVITTASTGGSAGRTRMVVVYALPSSAAAVKVAS